MIVKVDVLLTIALTRCNSNSFVRMIEVETTTEKRQPKLVSHTFNECF